MRRFEWLVPAVVVSLGLALVGCCRACPTAGPVISRASVRAGAPSAVPSRGADAVAEPAAAPAPAAAEPKALPPPMTWREEIARERGDARRDDEIRLDNTMIDAAYEGDAQEVRFALAAGARVSARYIDRPGLFEPGRMDQVTALICASIHGTLEMVRLLVWHGADLDDVDRRGRSALVHAAVRSHDAVAEALQHFGATGDPRRIRLTHQLLRAACQGFEMEEGEGFPPFPGVLRGGDATPTIDAVLAQGIEVDAPDDEGFTALMFAANLGLVDNVRLLLERGADARRVAKDGSTALSLASGRSSVNVPERAEVVAILEAHLATKRD